jgi:tRNA (guanine37-N1)-methyltransferase
MRITIITAFPDLIRAYLGASVLGRGIAKGKLEVEVLDIRDFAEGSYRQIDDYSYGSGGMVLMAEPLQKALKSLKGEGAPFVVYPSPQGTRLHQELVEDLSRKEHIVIFCGHYEGVDERFVEKNVDLEISIGDFVLTGGEMPAMAIVDAVSRLIPGVVGKSEAVREDSFFGGMLDTPHYTRPSEWEGQKVPEILLSGDEKAIKKWRRRQARHSRARRDNTLDVKRGLCDGSPLPCPRQKRRQIFYCHYRNGSARHREGVPHLRHKEVPSGHPACTAEGYGQEDRGPLD